VIATSGRRGHLVSGFGHAGDNAKCLPEDEIAQPRQWSARGQCDIGAYEAP
jgi:hypothetical protein